MVLIQTHQRDHDILSPEWLAYLAFREQNSEISETFRNFQLIAEYGVPTEKSWPFIKKTWTKSMTSAEAALCAQTHFYYQCLLAHRNPELLFASLQELTTPSNRLYDPQFAQARTEAEQFKTAHLHSLAATNESSFRLHSIKEVKSLLLKGIPVVMDLPFYFGAWNHSGGHTRTLTGQPLQIPWNKEMWTHGIVGYPEIDSIDRAYSPQLNSYHSVVLVGYDDTVVVQQKVLMTDGSTRTFQHQGVYYFKNSWGTGYFGMHFTLGGKEYPGYGMITQKYAEEFAAFSQLPLGSM